MQHQFDHLILQQRHQNFIATANESSFTPVLFKEPAQQWLFCQSMVGLQALNMSLSIEKRL